MRIQKIVTIDTEIDARLLFESLKAFMVRQDEALTYLLRDQQAKPDYENWDLLSVAPHPAMPGCFTSTWEYDPELHEDGDNIAEDDCAIPPFEVPTTNQNAHRYIGDHRVAGKVEMGELICVQSVLFKLTEFRLGEESFEVDFDFEEKIDETVDIIDSLEVKLGEFIIVYGIAYQLTQFGWIMNDNAMVEFTQWR